LTVILTDVRGKEIEKSIENIASVNISNIVNIEEESLEEG